MNSRFIFIAVIFIVIYCCAFASGRRGARGRGNHHGVQMRGEAAAATFPLKASSNDAKEEDDPGKGGIQYVVEVSLYRNMSGCASDGNFYKREFVWIHLKSPMRFERRDIFPSILYELSYDPVYQYLIHKVDSPDLQFVKEQCTVRNDFELCTFESKGAVPSSGYPNCYAYNKLITRRLKFRFCPAGYYFQGLLKRMCEQCEAGTYSEGMNTDTKCKSCPIPTDGTRCKPLCPPGQTVTADNRTCEKCQVGTFNPYTDSTCKKCQDTDSHWYQDQEGQTSCKTCSDKTDGIHCLTCGRGQYWTNSQCNACPAGTYMDELIHQHGECKRCTGNQYSDQTGQSSCKTCGHAASQGNTRCIACGPGTQWTTDDQCSPCPKGTFNPEPTSETAKCSQCPSHTYTDVQGSTSCKACGHDTDGTDCLKCGPGLYWQAPNNCVQCQPGYYKNEENDSPQCNLCPESSYAPRPGSVKCDMCSWPTDKTRTVCAPPCPDSGVSTRGQYGKRYGCICPPNTIQKPIYKVQYYQDESSICSSAVEQKLFEANDGGAIQYGNAKLDIVGYKNGTVYTFDLDKYSSQQRNINSLLTAKKQEKQQNNGMKMSFVQQQVYQKVLEDFVLAKPVEDHDDYSTRHLVIANRVNSDPTSTWQAKPNPKFMYRKFKEIRSRYFGGKPSNDVLKSAIDVDSMPIMNANANALDTENYDFRTAYSFCNFTIWDQGSCGSCVSVAATSVLGDRFCVETRGSVNVLLSPQHLLDCVHKTCEGWTDTAAFQSLNARGAPTAECYPYVSGRREQVGDCRTTCVNGGTMKMYYKQQGTHTYSSISAVKAALKQSGVLVASFNVYEDLLAYSGGVYVHKFGSLIEAHSIRVIGMGVENGVEYWLVANSWGTDFGVDGTFKVAMTGAGVNFGTFYGLDPSLTRL